LQDDYDSKLLGVTLNIPLYSGGKLKAEAQKAKIAYLIAKEKKSSEILKLRDEIEGLLTDIKRYDSTIQAKKEELISVNETKKVIEGRYKVGLATYTEVLDAVSSSLNAKLALLEAYYLKSVSIDRLRYLKGKIK
jgi:outer membrane protein TolC